MLHNHKYLNKEKKVPAFISFIETNLSFENVIANVWNKRWEFPQSCLYLKYFSKTYVYVCLSICYIFLYQKLLINIYINRACRDISHFSRRQICLEKITLLPFEHVYYWLEDSKVYLFDFCGFRCVYCWAELASVNLNLDWVYIVKNSKSPKSLVFGAFWMFTNCIQSYHLCRNYMIKRNR